MKSDISRQTFDPKKHYSQVIMQQGRVQLDADWNEQQELLRYHSETQSRDTIGQTGAPQEKGGFRLQLLQFTPNKYDVLIEPGRIYVDGLLCELEHETFVTAQPYYPDAKSHIDLPKLFQTEREGLLLAYLDVWERNITAVDDAHLREVALGGPDTATRLQTVWQVKILPVKIPNILVRLFQRERDMAEKQAELEQELQSLTVSRDSATRGRNAPSGRVRHIEDELRELSDERKGLDARITRVLHDYQSEEWWDYVKPPTGKMNVTTEDTKNSEGSGYRGLQNELYRVEIHDVTHHHHGPQTVKWARNNASILVKAKVKGKIVTVPGSGPSSILNFSRGQFVEEVNENTELNGQPGKLAQITLVDSLVNQLTLDKSLGGGEEQVEEEEIKIRLWDGKIENIKFDVEMPLDAGIKIRFSEGTYRPGDYWLTPARTSTGEVEWPQDAETRRPIPQAPRGVHHHYNRLAWICWRQGKPAFERIYDIRKRFTPLTQTVDAMHVAWINWNNDAPHSRKFLQWKEQGPKREGLRIWLDVAPDAHSIKAETLIVTAEVYLPAGGKGDFILNGHIEVRDNLIIWHWRKEQEGVLARLFEETDEAFRRLIDRTEHFVRVRVTLKGHLVWGNVNDRRVHLDGQALGEPHHEVPGSIALAFPSGIGARASDFESWFFMRE